MELFVTREEGSSNQLILWIPNYSPLTHMFFSLTQKWSRSRREFCCLGERCVVRNLFLFLWSGNRCCSITLFSIACIAQTVWATVFSWASAGLIFPAFSSYILMKVKPVLTIHGWCVQTDSPTTTHRNLASSSLNDISDKPEKDQVSQPDDFLRTDNKYLTEWGGLLYHIQTTVWKSKSSECLKLNLSSTRAELQTGSAKLARCSFIHLRAQKTSQGKLWLLVQSRDNIF